MTQRYVGAPLWSLWRTPFHDPKTWKKPYHVYHALSVSPTSITSYSPTPTIGMTSMRSQKTLWRQFIGIVKQWSCSEVVFLCSFNCFPVHRCSLPPPHLAHWQFYYIFIDLSGEFTWLMIPLAIMSWDHRSLSCKRYPRTCTTGSLHHRR